MSDQFRVAHYMLEAKIYSSLVYMFNDIHRWYIVYCCWPTISVHRIVKSNNDNHVVFNIFRFCCLQVELQHTIYIALFRLGISTVVFVSSNFSQSCKYHILLLYIYICWCRVNSTLCFDMDMPNSSCPFLLLAYLDWWKMS